MLFNHPSGLAIRSDEHARQYYEAHRPIGGPEYSDEVAPFLRDCDPTRNWDDIVRQRDLADERGKRIADVTQPIYGPGRLDVPDDTAHLLDEACARAIESYDPETCTRATAQVFLRLAKLSSHLGLVPTHHDPNTADFLWARWRMVFAGAGFHHWNDCATAMGSLYPGCPWAPEADQATWERERSEAHEHCGWPAQISHVRWSDACRCVATDPDGEMKDWHKLLAILHVLKHVRLDPTGHIVVMFDGVSHQFDVPDNVNVFGQHPLLLGGVIKALRAGVKNNPLCSAVTWVLNRLRFDQLIMLMPTSTLPPNILAGPWSTVAPDPQQDGFFQFGMRLEGVWSARGGKVTVEPGDDWLIGTVAWNITNSYQYSRQLEDFTRALPREYKPCFPVDAFANGFPNLVTAHFHPDVLDAAAVLFDVPTFANLLRPWIPEFRSEFPLVCFLPEHATQSKSTNQGKTLAAETYGRVTVPGIEAVKLKEGDSAPDSRTAMSEVQRFGTIVLDEFQMPSSKSHVLAQDNIQSLCVGKQVLAGLAYENTGGMRLSYGMTLSAKALNLNPDIINRSLFWFLDNLTEADRANADNLADLESGKTSLQMRLGAWAICEKHDLVAKLRAAPKSSSPLWRFGCHRALACLLYDIRQAMLPEAERSPLTADAAIDGALKQMRDRHREHTMDADDNGVLTMLEEGRAATLSLRAFFDGLGVADIRHMCDWMTEHGDPNIINQKFTGPKAMLDARLHLAGLTARPLCSLTTALMGRSLTTSDRAMCQMLADEIRRMVPEQCAWVLPDHLGVAGWKLYRGGDTSGGAIRVRLVSPDSPTPKDPEEKTP